MLMLLMISYEAYWHYRSQKRKKFQNLISWIKIRIFFSSFWNLEWLADWMKFSHFFFLKKNKMSNWNTNTNKHKQTKKNVDLRMLLIDEYKISRAIFFLIQTLVIDDQSQCSDFTVYAHTHTHTVMIHSNDDYFFLLTDNNKLIYISVYKHRMGKTKKMWIKFYQIYVKNKIEKKIYFKKKSKIQNCRCRYRKRLVDIER